MLCERGLLSFSRRFSPLPTGAPLVVAGFAQRVAEPLQALVETITRGSTRRLDILLHRQCGTSPAWKKKRERTYPCTLSQAVQAKFVGDFSGVHGIL
jgi:hypothetical protein